MTELLCNWIHSNLAAQAHSPIPYCLLAHHWAIRHLSNTLCMRQIIPTIKRKKVNGCRRSNSLYSRTETLVCEDSQKPSLFSFESEFHYVAAQIQLILKDVEQADFELKNPPTSQILVLYMHHHARVETVLGIIWEQGFVLFPWLAQNSLHTPSWPQTPRSSSCLYILSARITGVCHRTWIWTRNS